MNRDTITVRLVGGLGNQLFSYYAGKYLSQRIGIELILDTSFIDQGITKHNVTIESFDFPERFGRFSNQSRWINRSRERVIGKILREFPGSVRVSWKMFGRYFSEEIGYDPNIEEICTGGTVQGYFQTWRYFHRVTTEVNYFSPKLKYESDWFRDHSDRAKSESPIMLHVRRGDYKRLSQTFGLLSAEYYLDAMRILRDREISGKVWILSDDIDAARQMFAGCELSDASFIDSKGSSGSAESLLLLGQGRANVIANSTFSWWGAALSKSKPLVIAPETWFRGMPQPNEILWPNWLTIPSHWEDDTKY